MSLSPTSRAARAREQLAWYEGHWDRRDHRPGELQALATRERATGSLWRARRLEILAGLFELRSTGLVWRGFAGGTLAGLAARYQVSQKMVERLSALYAKGGLALVFRRWRGRAERSAGFVPVRCPLHEPTSSERGGESRVPRRRVLRVTG